MAIGLLVIALAMTWSIVVASDFEELRIRNDRDEETFNAAFGEGTCTHGESEWGRFGGGSVTFQELLESVEDGGHGAWGFNPDDTHIDEGDKIKVINQGGEAHTFTEVSAFGQGIIPVLNPAVEEDTPAVPVEDFDSLEAAAGATTMVAGGVWS
jgi:plastocyanin